MSQKDTDTNRIDSLPKLESQAEQQLNVCVERLRKLPPEVTSEPTSFVLDLITSFCRVVEEHIRGDANSAQLVQTSRKIYDRFKRDIHSSAPGFLPFATRMDLPSDLRQYLGLEDVAVDDTDLDDLDLDQQLPSLIFLKDIEKFIRKYVAQFIYMCTLW